MESFHGLSDFDTLRVINTVPIFAGIGRHEQQLLARKLSLIERNADEIVIEQGEIADRLYIIIRGRVLITIKSKSQGWVCINKLGAGDVFGEIAILRNSLRTARVTTMEPCVFLSINAQDFLEIYELFPPKSRDNIQLIVAKRLAQQNPWKYL